MTAEDVAQAETRVLVFPCGAESATEIHQALRSAEKVELFGASSVEDHGRLRFERYIGDLPRLQQLDFDRRFCTLVEGLEIDMVFGTHDSVIEHLAPVAQAAGFYLVNGDPEAAFVARRKSRTYSLFADQQWVPVLYPAVEQVERWPVVVKPDQGQGGQGVMLAHDAPEALVAMSRIDSPILVEYLPGDEVTVDCFTDRNRNLIWIGPRTRERIRAGISMRSRLVDLSSEIRDIAFSINSRLRLRGPWYFQVKRDSNDRLKLLEISCKLGAATVFQRARGINLPLMAVEDYRGRRVCAFPERRVELVDRSIATSAELHSDYHTVFIALEETLVSGTTARPDVLAFLYQAIGDGKRVMMLTRRKTGAIDALVKARIARELFDDIIQVPTGCSMAEPVTPGSLVIAHDASDRLEVVRNKGVPAMDVDALEFFLR